MTRASSGRTVTLFAVLFLSAAGAFSMLNGRGTGANDSALLPDATLPVTRVAADAFREKCGRCHPAEVLSRRLRESADPAATRRDFEALLASHGDASPGENRAILDWLSGRQ
mgnify:CR=1 FL=1